MAIKLKRGTEANIPDLQEGELGFTTDSKKVFIGSTDGNIEIGGDVYVKSNTAITGTTKTKITYDSKGLVTAGADATLDDIGDGSTRKLSNYVTKNTAITGTTKTKITYDSKGLVTAGADASLADLSDISADTPAVGNLLRYNGEEWAPASASGTYAGPTETYLGSRASSGTISVADIDNFDEIIIELYTFYTYYWDESETDTTTDFFVTRTILPHNKFEHYSGQNRDEYNSIGATLTTVNTYSNDIISVHVSRRNASGTELTAFFRGTLSGFVGGIPWGAGVRIYGRNW